MVGSVKARAGEVTEGRRRLLALRGLTSTGLFRIREMMTRLIIVTRTRGMRRKPGARVATMSWLVVRMKRVLPPTMTAVGRVSYLTTGKT